MEEEEEVGYPNSLLLEHLLPHMEEEMRSLWLPLTLRISFPY